MLKENTFQSEASCLQIDISIHEYIHNCKYGSTTILNAATIKLLMTLLCVLSKTE